MIIVERKRHDHPLYTRWRSMKSRCNDPKHKAYKRYGAAGIKVCDRWLDFWLFVEDMGMPPTKNHTVERIDSKVGYCKQNCKWATQKEQARNRSTNIWVEVDGLNLTIMDWAVRNGVPFNIYQSRIKRLGWDPVTAVTTPVVPGQRYSNIKISRSNT